MVIARLKCAAGDGCVWIGDTVLVWVMKVSDLVG